MKRGIQQVNGLQTIWVFHKDDFNKSTNNTKQLNKYHALEKTQADPKNKFLKNGKTNQTAIRKNMVQRSLFRKKLNTMFDLHIPHNTIHMVLLELGYAKQEISKQKRRKPWIRYERTHSLSLVHTDYHYTKDGRIFVLF
jgi:hypothetical protein